MNSPSKSRITASALDRLMTCEAAAVLDAVERSSAAGERGTAAHVYLCARHGGMSKADALAKVPEEWRDWVASIDVESIPGLGTNTAKAEMAFAYDVVAEESEFVGLDIGRAYPERPGAIIYGSVDFVVQWGDTPLEVTDYKSGREVPPPTSWQMKGLALFAARAYGVSAVTATIAQIHEDGTITRESATYDALALDIIAGELAELYARVMVAWEARQAGLTPKTTPSDEACRWCACRSNCPEYTTATVAIVPAMRNALSLADIDTAPDDVLAEHYDRVQRAKALVAEHEAAIEARAAAKPLQLANGDMLTLAPGEARDKIDDAIAAAVLTQRYGADAALAAASYSKAGLKRALGSDTDAALKAIRDAGGVEKKPGESKVRVIKAEAKQLAPRKRGPKAA